MQQTRKQPFLKQLHREGANYVLLAPALIKQEHFSHESID